MTQAYDAALQPLGLKATQYSVLAIIAMRGPMPLSQLADALALDRTTLTRNLTPLETQGWVTSQVGDDRRARLVTITKTGRTVLKQAEPLWRTVQKETVDRLGIDQWGDLIGRLQATTDVIQKQH